RFYAAETRRQDAFAGRASGGLRRHRSRAKELPGPGKQRRQLAVSSLKTKANRLADVVRSADAYGASLNEGDCCGQEKEVSSETERGIHEAGHARRGAGRGDRKQSRAADRSDEEAVGLHQEARLAGQEEQEDDQFRPDPEPAVRRQTDR